MQSPPPQSRSAALRSKSESLGNGPTPRSPGSQSEEMRVWSAPAEMSSGGFAQPDADAEEAGSSSTGTDGKETSSNAPLIPLHVLIVDDDSSLRKACAGIATWMGFYPIVADSAPAAREALAAQPVDLLLLDLKLPGGSGLTLLQEVREQYPNVAVVVMTAFATVSSAVEAMRSGASDYLTKPFGMDQLTAVLENASRRRTFDVEARALRDRIRADAGAGRGALLGRSPVMEKLFRTVSKVAFTSHPVLILGEAGTGKEGVARLIHQQGSQAGKPFIPVDCGCLAPALMEGELFGQVKGASPGAPRTREGLLVAAGSGTVFLDEVGELPLDLQAKLVRALQEKEVRPVGAAYSMPMAARILAASHQDLSAMVESGQFRRDLYFRLSVVTMQLPPLRERKEDIPLLAIATLQRFHREGKRCHLSDEAMRTLHEYDWPGNVRELEHAIEHAVALSSGPVLHPADFPPEMQNYRSGRRGNLAAEPGGLLPEDPGEPRVASIATLEKQAILNTIRQFKGDKLKAARLLGIGKTTLYRKLKEYGIDPGNLPED